MKTPAVVRLRILQSIVSEGWSYGPGVHDVPSEHAQWMLNNPELAELAPNAALTDVMAHVVYCRACGHDGLRYDGSTGGWKCGACGRWA
jgi:hypothetical protein